MSFDIYLRCFQGGEPAGVPREAVRSLFAVSEGESRRDQWVVRYDEQNSCNVSVTPCTTDSDLIESLSVARPCRDVRLWNALLEIMRLARIVFYCPGGTPPLVADASVREHLPRDMIKALGEPRVVASAQDILDAMGYA